MSNIPSGVPPPGHTTGYITYVSQLCSSFIS